MIARCIDCKSFESIGLEIELKWKRIGVCAFRSIGLKSILILEKVEVVSDKRFRQSSLFETATFETELHMQRIEQFAFSSGFI
jgi:hypothetical protein